MVDAMVELKGLRRVDMLVAVMADETVELLVQQKAVLTDEKMAVLMDAQLVE